MKQSKWWLMLIFLICFGAVYLIGTANAYPITVQVTWDIPTGDAVEYRFYYRIDNGNWIFHRSVAVITLPDNGNRTGRRFTAPDNGKVYRLVIVALDNAGNMSGACCQVVINTFEQSVSVEDEPVGADVLLNTS